VRAALLNRFRRFHDLPFILDRTRACHHDELRTANANVTNFHDGADAGIRSHDPVKARKGSVPV
jgi:hypothetical protein